MNNRKRVGIVFSIILLVVAATVIILITTNGPTETATGPEPTVSATPQPNKPSPSASTEPSVPGTTTDPSATTAPEDQPEPSKQPAPPPPDDYITTSGCLRGYGEPGQCVPAYYPDTDGNPSPVTCQDLRSTFPKGFKAAEGDPAGLDLNGDGTACGEDE